MAAKDLSLKYMKKIISEKKEKNVPIAKDVFQFKKETWKQHEKELNYIQEQFKDKLVSLQKMLIANKAKENFDYFKESNNQSARRVKKYTHVISNMNKSMQLDEMIEKEMQRQTNKYDFQRVTSHIPSNEEMRTRLQSQMNGLLEHLEETIHKKESLIEKLNNQLKKDDYSSRIDEINSYRARQYLIESTIEKLNKITLQTEQSIEEKGSQIQKIEEQLQIEEEIDIINLQKKEQDREKMLEMRRLQSMSLERQLYLQSLQKRMEFKQRIQDKVIIESSKLGILPKKKPLMTMSQLAEYIVKCKQDSQTKLPEYSFPEKKQRRLINRMESLPQITQNKHDEALTKSLSNTLVQPYLIQNSPTSNQAITNNIGIKLTKLQLDTNQGANSPQKNSLLGSMCSQYQTGLPSLQVQAASVQSIPQQKANSLHKIQTNRNDSLKTIQSFDQLINDCNKVHNNISKIHNSIGSKVKRKNIKLRQLKDQLSIIKNDNFLENDMILI